MERGTGDSSGLLDSIDEGCGGSAGQGVRQCFEEFDIDFAGSLGFGGDVNGVKFGGSHNGWGFGGVKGSGEPEVELVV